MKLVFKPVVTTPDEITAMLRDADAAPNCIGLVAWMHTFSPAKMWIGGLTGLAKPLCHLHTQFNRDIPWSSIDMDFMNLNQSAHGGREFGFICSRLRMNRKVVVGHWQEAEVHERLGTWLRAAAAWHDMRHMKIARIGDNMRQVAVTEGDKVEAEIRFGFAVNGYGLGDLVAVQDQVTERRSTRCARSTRRDLHAHEGPGEGRRPALTRCATRRASSWRCAPSSKTAASRASPTRSRTCTASSSCPASPRSG